MIWTKEFSLDKGLQILLLLNLRLLLDKDMQTKDAEVILMAILSRKTSVVTAS